jgi:hypothetical protein
VTTTTTRSDRVDCPMCKRPFDGRFGVFTEIAESDNVQSIHVCSVLCILRWLAHYQQGRPMAPPAPATPAASSS